MAQNHAQAGTALVLRCSVKHPKKAAPPPAPPRYRGGGGGVFPPTPPTYPAFPALVVLHGYKVAQRYRKGGAKVAQYQSP